MYAYMNARAHAFVYSRINGCGVYIRSSQSSKKVKSVGFSIMLFNFIYNESSGAKTFANHLVIFVDINVVSEHIATVVITITKS